MCKKKSKKKLKCEKKNQNKIFFEIFLHFLVDICMLYILME